MGDDVASLECARDAILTCQGYGLAELTFSIVDAVDALNINLRWGPSRPDLTLALRKVHYFAIHRLPEDDIPFFDLVATILVPNQPWPGGLPSSIATGIGLPTLLWIHGEGPATFDAVAAVITVLSEVCPAP